jgi:hypothetical protein
MSAKERREHLQRAIAEGGTIMTAKGQVTRQVPSGTTLAQTPDERRAAREDIERRARLLEEEARLLDDGGGDEETESFDSGRLGSDQRGADNIGGRGRGDDMLPENIPASARAALAEAGITSRSQLEGLTEEHLTAIKGIGQTTAARIREALR